MLSALDVHTARWVVDKCFTGDLIRGRTLILVTHNVAMTSRIADFVVSIGSDGRIASRGTISDALSHNKALLTEVAKEQEEAESEEKIIDGADRKEDTKPSGKLMTKEEVRHIAMWKQDCGLSLNVLQDRRRSRFLGSS